MTAVRRRRGRPPVAPGQQSVTLSVRVGEQCYDALSAAARGSRQEVAQFVRDVLTRQFCTKKSTAAIQ